MSNLATITDHNPQQVADDRTTMAALRDSFYPGATEQSVRMVLDYCRAAKLDPMTRPVHIVPMSVKTPDGKYQWRDVVMPGIELYRIKADRTGRYAGQDDAEFGPEEEQWGIRFPTWCKITVYKITDVGRVAYSATVRWREAYSTAKRDTDAPNAMWKKRPYGQLEKCAEAAALRKAFPEVGAQPTADEMQGKALNDAEPRDMGPAQTVDPEPPANRTDAVKSKLKSRTKQQTKPSGPSVDDVLSAIAAAKDLDALKAAGEQAKPLQGADREAALTAYKQRQAELREAAEPPADTPDPAAIEASLISAAKTAETEDERAEILDAARDLDEAARDRITAAFPAG